MRTQKKKKKNIFFSGRGRKVKIERVGGGLEDVLDIEGSSPQ